eukprot:822529-Pelagomonas_calceolata.AAC.1
MPSKHDWLLSTPDMLFNFRRRLGEISWVRGSGEREKESLGVEEHGQQLSGSLLALFLAFS